jgi:hypothetical protein
VGLHGGTVNIAAIIVIVVFIHNSIAVGTVVTVVFVVDM